MKLLVVNFHYYNETKFESGIYPVNQEQFTNQLNELALGYDFISQFDLADCFSKNQYPEGNYCLITFDDGLKEQMQAFDLLLSLKIPAAFYIPVQPLIEHNVLDVHKLQLIRTKMNDAEILTLLHQIPGYNYTIEETQKAATQYKYDDETAREIKFQLNFKLSTRQKKAFLSDTFNKVLGNENEYAKQFYMNQNDLQKLALQQQIGAHGYAHVPLALTNDAKGDMKKSIEFLFEKTQQPIRSISYPYGSKEAVNEQVAQQVKSLGLDFGLTMWRGLNTLNSTTNPFLLHRVDTNDAPGGKLKSTTYNLNGENSNS